MKIIAYGPITSCQINGEDVETVIFHFLRLQNQYRWWLQSQNEKMLAPWKKNYDKPRQCTKKQRHHIANKSPYSQSYGFSSSHVRMWELDHKEGWALKNWCFWTVVSEKTLERPLDCKEIKPVHLKGNQSWIFIGKTDVEAETPILWPPDGKNQLIRKDPDAGKGWMQEKGTTDGWMAFLSQWTWVWASSRWWWRTGKPGLLQSVGSQRVGHDWVTFTHSAFFMVQLSHPYMTTGKTTALTIWTFVSEVMSLLFNTLSRFVIDFLPRSEHL